MQRIRAVMSELMQALNRILDQRPDCISYLQPGLTYDEIEEKVKDLPFRLPKEVYELYQWRNGLTINDSKIEFFPGYQFLPLEEVLKERYIVSKNWEFLLPFAWFSVFKINILLLSVL